MELKEQKNQTTLMEIEMKKQGEKERGGWKKIGRKGKMEMS